MFNKTLIKTYLEHAPQNPGPIAPGLRGWTDGAEMLCSKCSGRILARGGFVKDMGATNLVWLDENFSLAHLPCVACGSIA